MAVIRVNKTRDFTIMSNYHFKEKAMSLKAKGLLSLMLSLPEDWDYSISGLVAICKENESAIKSTLQELKDFGYLTVDKIMPNKENGGRIEYIYNIFETPQQKQEGQKQGVENQGVVFMGVDNKILNNKLYNIDIKENKEKELSVENTNLCTPTQAESTEPSSSRNENQVRTSLIADNANQVNGTSAKKANQVGNDDIDKYFESTYKLYPRHESKVQGRKTYTKKLKGMSKEQAHSKAVYIYKCLEKQIARWQVDNRDKKYIPLISSWLNANFEDAK